MRPVSDFNTRIMDQFHADDGRVGPPFGGAPMVIVHHRGRRSGAEHVVPMVYLRDETDPDTVYVFASKAGAPTNPDWYLNLVTAGTGEVEVGPPGEATGIERYAVAVRELHGEERDRVYAAQVAVMPGFADYEEKTKGIRTIPVLGLTRA
ncbi:nitroreductase family deazaflavin-dependent oxidoreductase [Jatrophihabitans sp. YIM 134969]